MDISRDRLALTDAARWLGVVLAGRGLWLATAESCTGGLIAATLTDVPGASAWFKGGVVAYTNEVKELVLDVPAATLETHGAVSLATVRAMALGICRRIGASVGVAVSGIAGPTGGSLEKPVGTVCIAVAMEGVTLDRVFHFTGDRASVRVQTVAAALAMVAETVRSQAAEAKP